MSNALRVAFIDIRKRLDHSKSFSSGSLLPKQVFEGYRMERFVRGKTPNATLAKEKDLINQSLFQRMFRDVV